jgi:hypothetical protein
MKRILTAMAAAATLVMVAAPAGASAAVRTGSVQDAQGDAAATLSGAALDIKSAAVSYDDVTGTVRVTWTYYGDVRANYDPSSPPQGIFSPSAPVAAGVPTDYAVLQWTGLDSGGSWSVSTTLQLYGSSGFLSGTGTTSADGHAVTAEFTNASLAGHDWQRGFGSTVAGDDFPRFWFDGYSEPSPPGTTPPLPGGPGSGPTDIRTGMTVNDGAQYTNDPDVTLSVIAPSSATTLRVANDGGFLKARTMSVAPSIHWRLDQSGRERLPKTVYLRFGSDVQTFTDDIILDQTEPTVTSATLVESGSATTRTAVAAAAAAKTRTYRVRVRASDATSGVGQVQFAASKRHPAKLHAIKRIGSYTGVKRPRFVRVRDRAGNYSRWRSIR